jgi:hypothetical protein
MLLFANLNWHPANNSHTVFDFAADLDCRTKSDGAAGAAPSNSGHWQRNGIPCCRRFHPGADYRRQSDSQATRQQPGSQNAGWQRSNRRPGFPAKNSLYRQSGSSTTR